MYLWWKAHFLPQGNFQMLTGMKMSHAKIKKSTVYLISFINPLINKHTWYVGPLTVELHVLKLDDAGHAITTRVGQCHPIDLDVPQTAFETVMDVCEPFRWVQHLRTKVDGIAVKIQDIVGARCRWLFLMYVVDDNFSTVSPALDADCMPVAIIDRHGVHTNQAFSTSTVETVLEPAIHHLQTIKHTSIWGHRLFVSSYGIVNWSTIIYFILSRTGPALDTSCNFYPTTFFTFMQSASWLQIKEYW